MDILIIARTYTFTFRVFGHGPMLVGHMPWCTLLATSMLISPPRRGLKLFYKLKYCFLARVYGWLNPNRASNTPPVKVRNLREPQSKIVFSPSSSYSCCRKKSIPQYISVLIVDKTAYSTRTNCRYPLASFRTYKIVGLADLPAYEF